MLDTIALNPIGKILTTCKLPKGTPIQSTVARDKEGRIILDEEYMGCLKDLNHFSHCIILYYFHKVKSGWDPQVKPFLDTTSRGLFATRAPRRPNPIGISIVKLLSIQNNEIRFSGVDIVDETPILDIKPYIPIFDCVSSEKTRIGWLEGKLDSLNQMKDDGRFSRK
jgi:tRNA-Thr(GGU) m(6)t(6)A37 methyltransferase TsaA